MIKVSGIPLGIKKEFNFKDQILKMNHGDYIVFYTDGVIEARDTNKKEIGLNGIIEYLNREWQSPEQLIHKINKEILKFTKSADQHDDITLVVLKWC